MDSKCQKNFALSQRVSCLHTTPRARNFAFSITFGRRVGVAGNYWARCPSCADHGRDRSGDNLAISVSDPRKYKCWAGCTKEMIRAALGQPIRVRRQVEYGISAHDAQ